MDLIRIVVIVDRKDKLVQRALSELNEPYCGIKQVTTGACLAGYFVFYDRWTSDVTL